MSNLKRLSCPHCGAKMAFERPRCMSCGDMIDWTLLADPPRLELDTPRSARSGRTGIFIAMGVVGIVVAVSLMIRLTSPAPTATPGSSQPAPPAGVAATGTMATPAVQESAATPISTQSQAERAAGDAASHAVESGPALARWQEAIKRDPADTDALNNAGQILLRLNRAHEALQLLDRAATARPENTTYLFNLAVALEQDGQIPRAVEYYRKLAAATPSDPRVHYNLGRSLRQLGKDDEAIPEFEKATALDSGHEGAWLELAISLDRAARADAAATAFERYLALAPDSPDAPRIRQRVARLRQSGTTIAKLP